MTATSQAADENCTWCGLPLPRALFGRTPVSSPEPRYCCTGCRIAAAMTQETGDAGAATWTMTALGLSVFFSMSVMVFTVAHWMYGAYDLETGQATALSTAFGQLLQWLALLFSIPVVLLLGKPLVDDAVVNLRSGVVSSDVLLLTGVAASFTYSLVNVIRGEGPVYFETGCVILLAVTFGRWLSATGRLRTNAVLDELQRLLPESARVLRAGQWTSVPLDDVRVGEVLAVQAGERAPVDGRILHGAAAMDEQVFTGESHPVSKNTGDSIFGGTLNLDGSLQVLATSLPRQGAFGALVEAVRKARNSKGHYQILADRVSAGFFPIITSIALGTLVVHGFVSGWSDGMMAALSVVLIACPCALALATPLAVWAAMGRAARQGILFRGGEALERLARVDTIRFDKTGTLTTGSPRIADVQLAEETSYREFAARAHTLAAESSHVFSRAIRQIVQKIPEYDPVAVVRTVPGCGLEAQLGNDRTPTRLGSWEWLTARGAASSPRLQDDLFHASRSGQSLVALSWNGQIQGFFRLAEEIRPGALQSLEALRSMDMDLAILTGDRSPAASRIASELKLRFEGELSPEGKSQEVDALRRMGAVVAMVGDGINDAPALTAADVGVALGCGTDVTRSTADVCLLRNDLGSLVEAIRLSQECVACIRGNLVWSFAYNAVGVALAAAGWLHPSFAALVMVVSSLAVLTRSLSMGGTAVPAPVVEGNDSHELPQPVSAHEEPTTPALVAALPATGSTAAPKALP